MCKGNLKYTGIGEYICEKCKNIELDDYGKVRKYLEVNRGANSLQIEAATGVSRHVVGYFLEEGRIQLVNDRKNI